MSRPQSAKKISIPDYEKLHEQFYQQLQKNKKEFVPSKSQPFKFQDNGRTVNLEHLDYQNKMVKLFKQRTKHDIVQRTQAFLRREPRIPPPSNLKYTAWLQKTLTDRANELKKVDQEMQEQTQRKQKEKQIRSEMKQSGYFDALHKPAEIKRRTPMSVIMKAQEKEYQKKIQEMNERVKKRPYMVAGTVKILQ